MKTAFNVFFLILGAVLVSAAIYLLFKYLFLSVLGVATVAGAFAAGYWCAWGLSFLGNLISKRYEK